MNRVAGIELEPVAVNPDALLAFTDQVHLDAPPGRVVGRVVRKGVNIEVPIVTGGAAIGRIVALSG